MRVLFSSAAVQYIGYFTLTSNLKLSFSRYEGGRGSHVVGLQEWEVVFVGYICFSHVLLSIRKRNYLTADTNTTEKTALFANTFLHIFCLVLFAAKSCGRNKRYRLSLFCQSLVIYLLILNFCNLSHYVYFIPLYEHHLT
jgi:hypothetical protein